jgi:hypothetical protein
MKPSLQRSNLNYCWLWLLIPVALMRVVFLDPLETLMKDEYFRLFPLPHKMYTREFRNLVVEVPNVELQEEKHL